MTQLGFIPGLSNEEYHNIDALGSSLLRQFLKSPEHYKYFKDNKVESTDAMKLGTAIHMAILEPALFKETYIQKPKNMHFGTIEGKAWKAAAGDKQILPFDDYVAVYNIYEKVISHERLPDLLRGGLAEQSFCWCDANTGLLCKSRPDFIGQDYILDIKTTSGSADVDGFLRSTKEYRHDIQAAFYLRGMPHIKTFIHVVIEKNAPHGIAIYEIDAEDLKRAQRTIDGALVRLTDCIRNNNYPGYTADIQRVILPPWIGSDGEENE